jgi:hypothetical protein
MLGPRENHGTRDFQKRHLYREGIPGRTMNQSISLILESRSIWSQDLSQMLGPPKSCWEYHPKSFTRVFLAFKKRCEVASTRKTREQTRRTQSHFVLMIKTRGVHIYRIQGVAPAPAACLGSTVYQRMKFFTTHPRCKYRCIGRALEKTPDPW